MERDMDSTTPSIIDLHAELAKLTMFRRTPQSTRAETKGSVARLASYRDGLLLAIKSSGTDHWERHLTGDELIHILDGTAMSEIVCDDGPPKSFALRAGMVVVIPQGAWHRGHSSEGTTQINATPFPGEHVELDVDIVPPRSGAVPSATAETAPTKRDRHLQLIAERGRMGWQRVSGYNWRALVEADIGRYKRVIGDALRSRTKGRQMTEVAIAVASLNRMLELGRPEYLRLS